MAKNRVIAVTSPTRAGSQGSSFINRKEIREKTGKIEEARKPDSTYP